VHKKFNSFRKINILILSYFYIVNFGGTDTNAAYFATILNTSYVSTYNFTQSISLNLIYASRQNILMHCILYILMFF